jgi:phosphatidylglycerophosphatase A
MISIRKLPPTLHGTEPFYLLATWFYAGRIKPVSGSWGTLAALPFCWLVKYAGGTIGLILFAAITYALGVWAIKKYLPHTKQADPSEVVIDEVMGMAVVFLFLPLHSFVLIALGFVVFRLWDGIKRGPVGWCDRNIKGPNGVMFDDLVAAILAGVTMLIIQRLLF